MNNQSAVWGLIILALLAANLPFFTNRFLLLVPLKKYAIKPVAYRLLEVLLYYFITGFVGIALEQKMNGQLHSQDWEFYVVTFFLFLVMAMPGFIYRYTFSKQKTA